MQTILKHNRGLKEIRRSEALPRGASRPLYLNAIPSTDVQTSWSNPGVTAEYPATSKQYLRNSGYAATWLRGYVATWLRSYVATWLWRYAATWLRSYVAVEIRGYAVLGYAANMNISPVFMRLPW